MQRPIRPRPPYSIGQAFYEAIASVRGPEHPGVWPEWRDLAPHVQALTEQRGTAFLAFMEGKRRRNGEHP